MSETIHNSLYGGLRLAEINQQTYLKSSCFQVIQALRGVNIVQCPDGLDFYDDTLFNQKVGDKVPDQYVFVVDFYPALLGYLKAGPAKFHRQRILVDFLQKPRAEDVAYLMDAADDLFSYLVQS